MFTVVFGEYFMPAIVGAIGIAYCWIAKKFDLPEDEQISMFIEKMAKSNAELKASLDKIKNLLDSQILGKIDAAGIALENSLSPDLNDAQKAEQVIRAWYMYEECYAQLNHIPHLAYRKSEVAILLALCHARLGNKTLTEKWFGLAKADLTTFLAVKPPEYTSIELTCDTIHWSQSIYREKVEEVVNFSLYRFTPRLANGKIGKIFSYIADPLSTLALPLARKVEQKSLAQSELSALQNDALEMSAEVDKKLQQLEQLKDFN
jgi:hypothetical protein